MWTLSLLLVYSYSISLSPVAGAKVLGVPPDRQQLYIPGEDDKWRCLNNSEIELDFSQINDGVCDCPDGSDEPGTAACGETLEHRLFYCENEGFIPRFIRGSLVGDGVCDCCDCSDEKLSDADVVIQNTCADLAQKFDQIVETEFNNYELGKQALIDLFNTFEVPYSINGTVIGPNGSLSKMTELEEDIAGLKLSRETTKSMLNKTRENYLSKLEREDPLLFQFERIDFEYLSKIINATYERIATINSAYVDIVELLKELARGHSPSAGDLVVNKNMRDFNLKLQDPETQKLIADPNLDMEQLDQINEYLNVELPRVFWTRESKFPVGYVINKAKFVESLIKGKTDYTEKVKSHIAFFTGLMDDIRDKFTISTQNDAVERAIIAYENYQEKYSELLSATKLELPKQFVAEFDRLCTVVQDVVPKLELEVHGEGEDEGSGSRAHRRKGSGFWGLFRNNPLFGLLLTDPESLRKQISEYTAQLKVIDVTIKERELELEQLKLLEESEEKVAADVGLTRKEHMALKQLTELLEKIHPPKSCIGDVSGGYEYHLCYNPLEQGRLIQIEDKPAGKRVVLGEFSGMYFDKAARLRAFLNHMRMDHVESDILPHLSSDSDKIGEKTYFFRELEKTDSGLVIEYTHGARCWNGPLRSAKVFFSCSDKFAIDRVYETTRCEYVIDASGPIGCNLNFAYEAHKG